MGTMAPWDCQATAGWELLPHRRTPFARPRPPPAGIGDLAKIETQSMYTMQPEMKNAGYGTEHRTDIAPIA